MSPAVVDNNVAALCIITAVWQHLLAVQSAVMFELFQNIPNDNSRLIPIRRIKLAKDIVLFLFQIFLT